MQVFLGVRVILGSSMETMSDMHLISLTILPVSPPTYHSQEPVRVRGKIGFA